MTKQSKNKSKKLSNLLMVIALVLSFSTVCLALFGGNITHAASEKQSWSNLNFADGRYDTSSNVSTSPSGWTRKISSDQTTSGSINLSKYNSSYYLNSNNELPKKRYESADNHVLMINSKSATSTLPTNQYYTNSSSLSLDPYSQYKVIVWVQVTTGASGSIYITGLDETIGFTDIDSNFASSWKAYTFYISTGIDKEEIKTELWLGGKGGAVSDGAVFFDNIEVYKISNDQTPNFVNTQENYISTPTSLNDSVKHINLNSENAKIIPNINGTFENVESGNNSKDYNLNAWTKTVTQMKNGTYAEILDLDAVTKTGKNLSDIGTDLTKGNEKALVLYTADNVKSHFGLKSSQIPLAMYETVKVSVNVKVANLDGNASVKFVESDVLDANGNIKTDITPVTKEITISSNSSNKLMNNYTTCSFYIKGRSLYNTNFRLELALGSSDTETSGIAVFDNITIEPISNSKFSSITTDSTNVSISLQNEDGSYGVTNATFDHVEKENATLTYPLIPTNWTHNTSDKNNVFYGVINTYNPVYAEYHKVSGFANPGNPEGFLTTDIDSNNILVMHNINNAYQTITSSAFDVSANKYYKLSFDYKLLQSASSNLLTIEILDDANKVLYSDNTIQSSSDWQKYNIYVSTNSYTNNLKVVIKLGTSKNLVRGVVYLDNVMILEESNLSQEKFELLSKSENVLAFQEGNFNIVATGSNTLKTPLRYTGTLEVGENGNTDLDIAYGGIIDGANTEDEYDEVTNSPENTNSLKHMMLLQTHGKATYSMTANDSLSLTSGSYYKFSVWALTKFGQDAENSTEKYGAEFGLNGLNEKISNIVAPVWTKYSIYVNCTTDTTINLRFAISSQNTETAGKVYFDNYSYETIDADTFNKDKINNKNNTNYLFVGNTDTKSDNNTTTPGSVNLEYIWFVIPSLILGVALVVAVIAYAMKKVKIKKWEKRKVNEYDREKTVHRDVIRKDAEKIRDNKVAELKQEIVNLEQQVEELKQKHSTKVNEARKDRAKGISRGAEKEFKQYAKYNTALENKIARLQKEIDNMNTPEYLLGLQHKIAVEKAKQERLSKEKASKKSKSKK